MKTLKLRHPLWPCKLSRTSFPDVKLTTQDGYDKTVVGHRVLLASVSTKLAGLFNKQGEGVVMVRNLGFSHLEAVVNFLYTGSVCIGEEFTEEDLQDVLNLLQVDREVLGEIEEDLEDVLNLLQVDKEVLGEIVDKEGLGEIEDSTVELQESLKDSECVDGNKFPEKDEKLSPSKIGKMVQRQNENEDSSEHSKNNVSVASSSITVEDDQDQNNVSVASSGITFEVDQEDLDDFCQSVDTKGVNTGRQVENEDADSSEHSKTYMSVASSSKTVDVGNNQEDFRQSVGSKRVNTDGSNTENHRQSVDKNRANTGRANENEGADSSEHSKNKVSVASNSITVDVEKNQEDLRQSVGTRRVNTDDSNNEHLRLSVDIKRLNTGRENEDENADSSEHSKSNLSVASSSIAVDVENNREDLSQSVGTKRVYTDDSKIALGTQKISKTNVNKRFNPRIHCTYCMQKVSYAGYRGHCRTFHPETPFDVDVKCKKCPKIQAISKVSLQFHNRIFHPQDEEVFLKRNTKEIISTEENVLGKSLIKCEFCNTEVRFDNYVKHCRTKHQQRHKVQRNEKVECPACKNKKVEGVFVSRACLPLHMKMHHGDQTNEASEETRSLGLKKGGSRMQVETYLNLSENQKMEKEETKSELATRKVKVALKSKFGASNEDQNNDQFRVFFTYKGLMKKSFVCLKYWTKMSVLFEKYIRSLKVDTMVMKREQVVFRCSQVDLSGLESVGTFHNQTVEVCFI